MSEFRLDYIEDFMDGTVEEMERIRKKYVALENEIKNLLIPCKYNTNNLDNITRVYTETLSHIEKSQMYAIKLLCLIGEKKDKK